MVYSRLPFHGSTSAFQNRMFCTCSLVCTRDNDDYYDTYKALVKGIPVKSGVESGDSTSVIPDSEIVHDSETSVHLEQYQMRRAEHRGRESPYLNLTHTDQSGKAKMVDVGHKEVTKRIAIATGSVILGEIAFGLVRENRMKKGDVLSVAHLAGVMAAKKTSDLIPLCHNIPLNKIHLELKLNHEKLAVDIVCEVHCYGRTGVEMEALTGVSVAALTVYDMCKAVTQDMVIEKVCLQCKTGGQRGTYQRVKD